MHKKTNFRLHSSCAKFSFRVTEARRKIETSVDIGSEKMVDSIGKFFAQTSLIYIFSVIARN